MNIKYLKTTRFLGNMLLAVLVTALCFITGCAGDVENGATGYVRFASSDNSRSIEEGNKLMYPAENLYWAYTAVKKDGNYTVGQSEKATGSAVSGVSVSDGGRLLLLKSMKSGPETGMGTVGPFSVGTWEFKLYGYKGCKLDSGVYKFSDLIYTASKEVVIDDSSIVAAKDVVFELTLTVDTTTVAKGKLELGQFKMILPKNQKIFGTKPALDSDGTPLRDGAEVIVKIFKGEPGADNLIAESTTIVTDDITIDYGAFDINFFVFEKNTDGTLKDEFNAGDTDFYFVAEYLDEHTYSQKDIASANGGYKFSGNTDYTKYAYDDGYAPVFDAQAYPVYIRAGVVTTLDGEINEFMGKADANAKNTDNNYIVTKILKTGKDGTDVDDWDYYNSLKDAVAAYGDTDHMNNTVSPAVPNPIILVRDVENAGTISLSKNVVVKNCGFYVNDLSVSGAFEFTFKLADSNRDYCFKSGKIASLNYDGTASGNVWLHTEGGTLTMNAPSDNVYHTGRADSVTLTAVAKTADTVAKGYFLGTESTGSDPETSVSVLEVKEGSLNIGGEAAIQTLKVSAGSDKVTVCGRTTSHVGNIDKIRDNDSSVVTATNKDVFRQVKFDKNGGTATTSPVTKYGIEGMYMNLVSAADVSFTAPSSLLFNCWNTKDDRTGDDYSATGKIAVVKDGGGDYPTLYAVWGYPVAKIEPTTDGVCTYFGSLHDAVSKYATDDYGGTSNPNPIVLLRNIDTDTVAPAGAAGSKVKIKPNGFSLKNITVSTVPYIEVDVAADRVYTFGGIEGNKLDEFSYMGSDVTIRTTGGHLNVNAATDDISHYGTISNLGITKAKNDVENGEGYHLGAVASGTVTLESGFLEIDANINTLNVKTGGSVSLKGRANTAAVVTTCKLDGTVVNTWAKKDSSSGAVDATKEPYKQVILDANADATLTINSVTTAASGCLTMHYIEGLKVSLSNTVVTGTKPGTANSAAKLSEWNTVIDKSGVNVALGDIRVPAELQILYACWNTPVATILRSDGKTGYFYTLKDAVAKYGTATYKTGTTVNVIKLVNNVENAGTITPDVSQANILSNNWTIKNLRVGATGKTFRICVGTTDGSRVYSFSSNAQAVLSELSNSGNSVTLKTANGTGSLNVTVDASSDSVTHTGVVGTLTINNIKYSTDATTRKSCYNLNATTGTVKIYKGSLYINSCTVSSLMMMATSSGVVNLLGNTSGSVTNMSVGTTDITNGYSSAQTTYGTYKQIKFVRNKSGAEDYKYIYGIEGMYRTLPVFYPSSARTTYGSLGRPMFTVPTRSNGSDVKFIFWYKAQSIGKDTTLIVKDGEKITVGSSDLTLYAGWGSCVGGTFFQIPSVATRKSDCFRWFKLSSGAYTYVESADLATGVDYTNMYYLYITSGTNSTVFDISDTYYVYNNNSAVCSNRGYYTGSTHPSALSTVARVLYSSANTDDGDYYIGNSVWLADSTVTASWGTGRNNTNLLKGSSSFNKGTMWTYLNGTVNKTYPNLGAGNCNDWYIPSGLELAKLQLFNNYWPSSGIVVTWISSNFNKSTSTNSDNIKKFFAVHRDLYPSSPASQAPQAPVTDRIFGIANEVSGFRFIRSF